MHQQLARLAFIDRVHQHLAAAGRVPVMLVVRRGLEMPFQLAGIDVDGGDGVAVEIVALAHLVGVRRIGLAGAIDDGILFRIEGAAHPDGATAFFLTVGPGLGFRLADLRDVVPGPEMLAGLGVIGLDVTVGLVQHADNQLALDRHGRNA